MDFKVAKCPTDELAVANCAIFNSEDINAANTKHIVVQPRDTVRRYVFSVRNHPNVKRSEVAFASTQRSWATLSLGEIVKVSAYNFQGNQYIGAVTVAVDFQKKKDVTPAPLDTDYMARQFSMQFVGKAFTKGEKMVFQFVDDKGKTVTLSVIVKTIEGIDLNAVAADKKASHPVPVSSNGKVIAQIDVGSLLPNSVIIFDKDEGSQVNLIGKSKGKTAYRSIMNPDWDFQKMGIGGLDGEFSDIFRRAFASRVFPPEYIEQLGMKHVRGILLYGPPGTGKTLMARQIGKMLNAREPKIVNGPQILDKYVGESESNIRKLFADAEEEWKRCGCNSGLHMIIFDEIDAICKQRGSMAGSSSVHDTVVNQLLSKMDGVEQLNNILVIGMTNRKDMIDEALLRPGRFEVHLEIGLPDEFGRLQILKIHTAKMREYGKMDPNVNLDGLATQTKNFTGAEIEALVKAAQSSAMNRLIKVDGKVETDPDAIEKLMVNAEDFAYALENDVKAAFGRSEEALERYIRNDLIMWGEELKLIMQEGKKIVNKLNSEKGISYASCLLYGSARAGTTCMAANLARDTDFPFVKVIDPYDMVGFTETARCQMLKKSFADALRSKTSVLFIDRLERIVDYCAVGPRFSNLVLQSLLVLINQRPPKGHRLLILATSSSPSFVREFELFDAFDFRFLVPNLTEVDQIMHVAQQSESFSAEELNYVEKRLHQLMDQNKFTIGIKDLECIIQYSSEEEEGQRGMVLYTKIEKHLLSV